MKTVTCRTLGGQVASKAKTVKCKPAKKSAKPKTVPHDNGKHPGGRPPLYDDPAVMQAKIDEYFTFCDNRIKVVDIDKEGEAKTAIVPEPYTIEGLCHFLGFEDRDALRYYGKKPEFSRTIKKARLKVNYDNVRRLLDGKNPVGVIFWLKNNASEDYRDKVDHEVGGPGGGPIQHSVKVTYVNKPIS